MKYKKIVPGFVIQTWDEKGVIEGQEFIAGDQTDWEDDKENPVEPKNWYAPYSMKQPAERWMARVLYNDETLSRRMRFATEDAEDVFFIVKDEDELKSFMKEDNGEDFVVLEYEKEDYI